VDFRPWCCLQGIVRFIQEGRRSRHGGDTAHALRRRAMVLRGGERRQMTPPDLVPGDILLLEPVRSRACGPAAGSGFTVDGR